MFTDYKIFIDQAKSYTNKDEGYISEGNEVIFPSSTTVDALSLIAPCAVISQGILLGGDMFGIKLNPNYDPIFISAILQTEYQGELAKKAQGSTIIHLHYDDIKNIPVKVPTLSIQKEISKMIVSLFKTIANEAKVLTALENLKRYLLAGLFC